MILFNHNLYLSIRFVTKRSGGVGGFLAFKQLSIVKSDDYLNFYIQINHNPCLKQGFGTHIITIQICEYRSTIHNGYCYGYKRVSILILLSLASCIARCDKCLDSLFK